MELKNGESTGNVVHTPHITSMYNRPPLLGIQNNRRELEFMISGIFVKKKQKQKQPPKSNVKSRGLIAVG